MSARQVSSTQAIVEWYLRHHYGGSGDVGLFGTFTSPAFIGAFAVDRKDLINSDPEALFRLLVAVAMFQRLRDTHVMGILRAIPRGVAREITSAEHLLELASSSSCPHLRSNAELLRSCDLTKDSAGTGVCASQPRTACHLKVHTEWLRRYGHFGKVPTSAALALRDTGARDLNDLRERVFAQTQDPLERSRQLELSLERSWRVGKKIASMFLSLVATPNLGINPPWRDGLDWTWFVVIDGNVDRALAALGYTGTSGYDARRAFMRKLAERIDLQSLDARLPSFHPRLVQQALYLFMSVSNRRRIPHDCSREAPRSCLRCVPTLRSVCPLERRARRLPVLS